MKIRVKSKKVVKVIKKMKKIGAKVLRGEEWEIRDDLVLK